MATTAIKVIIGKANKKYRRCLRCNQQIEAPLRDNSIYTCERCGQQHLVDVYRHCIHLTVAERPEVRRRPAGKLTPEQLRARQRLIDKVEAKKRERAAL